MNSQRPYALMLCAILFLTACGGGGDALTTGIEGSGQPIVSNSITSAGAVTGKGSIIVNNVDYDLAGASITFDGYPARESDLRVGHLVIVEGELDGSGKTGTAQRVSAGIALAGAIVSVDLALDRFTVLGQTVEVGAPTLIEGRIEGRPLGGLEPGNDVEVSGFADSSGVLFATRVARRQPNTPLQLTGYVANLDAADRVFSINGQLVDYASATLIGFESRELSAAAIRVVADALDASGALRANEVALRDLRLPGAVGDTAEVQGWITRFGSERDFDVGGHAVVATANTSGDVVRPDAFVRVKGKLVMDGVVTAEVTENIDFYLRYGEEGDIFVTDERHETFTLLTRGAWPAWSPDGQRIAFSRAGQIRLIDADGSNESPLIEGTTPTWSPDGARLAFTSREGISVVDLNGAGVTTLIRHDFRGDTYAPWDLGISKPAWSPDGQRIAFEHLGDGDTQPAQIFVMNADGSDLRYAKVRASVTYAESTPSWSPDGSKIAFWSYGHGLAAVDANSGVLVAAGFGTYPPVVYGAKPVWSPDGNSIAFTTPGSEVWRLVNGGAAELIVRHAWDQAWAPAERIAFVSVLQCRGGWEIVLRRDSVDGGFYYQNADAGSLSVRVGAPVQWVNHNNRWPGTSHIVSLSEPPGGARFDSGMLEFGDAFHFYPNVAGTWEYIDQVSELRATLTADFDTRSPECG